MMNEANVPTQDTSQTAVGTIPSPTITTVAAPVIAAPDPAVRFRGLGTNFKAKLIGIDEVPDSRGDKMCQESILKLKAAVQASGQHKQKIVVNVSLEGIKIVDIISGEVQHVHPVHRISFIARDLTDRRAFGYVYGAGEGRHQFFGIKTAKVAEVLVLALRDLFQVVYDMKKKEMEEKGGGAAKAENGPTQQEDVYAVPQKTLERQNIETSEPAVTMRSQQSQGSLLDLEQQLTNIQEGINNIDSFSPWPQDTPTSPDTPFSPGDESGSDMFGIANLSDISSLSSDFSCASASVLDYGHAGGGERGSQHIQHFQRSSSSRSAISWHGFKQGHHHVSPRASSHSAKNHRLGSVPDFFPSVSEEGVKSGDMLSVPPIIEGSQVPEETIEWKKLSNNRTASKASEVSEGKKDTKKMEKTRDTLRSSSSTLSLPESDKKLKKSTSSGFFSRSKKSTKKSKSKKEKASMRHKGSKSADERISPALSDTSSPNIAKVDLNTKTILKKTNSTFEFTRRDSVSSVNSVQSCVVPSTTYSDTHKFRSSSRTSLDNVSKRPLNTKSPMAVPIKTSTENVSSIMPSYIVQSSICPRTRPKVKHTGRVAEAEHNPHNPPMFKTHHNEAETTKQADVPVKTTKSSPVGNMPPSSSKPPLGWTASFDADFDSFEKNKIVNKKPDEKVDPFTGLESQDLKVSPSSSANFDDTAWGAADAKDQQKLESPATEFEDPFKTDPFANEASLDFAADPFSTKDGASPFDGVDPFADVKMEDPLADPFSAFEENDIFGENNTNDPSTSKTTVWENVDSDTLKDAETIDSDTDTNRRPGSEEPTFPHGSEEFTITLRDLKNVTATSADSSSLTSGMSSPIVASSPVHCAKMSPHTTSTNTAVPPPLPPRLPPRPRRITIPESNEHDERAIECPSVPPPPLPDTCPTPPSIEDTDEDLFEDFNDSFADTPDSISEVPKLPPAIPQRSSISVSSSGHSSESEKSKESLVHRKSSDIPFLKSGGSGGAPKNATSYSDDLFSLSAQAVEPAPQPGAKLTANQILAGFGGAGGPMGQQQGMFPGQPRMMMPPGQYGGGYQQQPVAGFQQNVAAQPYGMFPSGPSPAIPPRPGAMRPPAPQVVPGGAPQNPFGDATGVGGGVGGMLAPSSQAQGQAAPERAPDPFSNLIPGIGGSGAVNKKDMFKNFQMAKAPQPPPRTNPPQNGAPQAAPAGPPQAKPMSDFDNYFLNSVGGVPLVEDSANNNAKAPVAAPRGGAPSVDPFGFGDISTPSDTADPFASNNAFTQPFEFNQNANNNVQSLFG